MTKPNKPIRKSIAKAAGGELSEADLGQVAGGTRKAGGSNDDPGRGYIIYPTH